MVVPPETGGNTELDTSKDAAPNEKETQNFAGETWSMRSTRRENLSALRSHSKII